MDTTNIVQIILGVVISAMGYFLKRVFEQLDASMLRIRDVEIDVATLTAEARDLHERLERIEDKIDRLLERRLPK